MQRIAKGAATVGLINVVRVAVQVVSVPVIARVISPDDYGLAAMAMPVVLFLMMLADAGLGTSLIRAGRPHGTDWHTCFWLSAALGAAAGTLVAALAPVAAYLLSEPRLAPIILALAVVIPLQTLTLVPGAALQQRGRFGAIASVEIAAMAAGIGTAVSLAVSGFGVWALVWQQVAFYSARLALTLARSSYRPRFVFDLRGAREHVAFGRCLLGASLVSFAARSLENLVIGRVAGPGPVGVYAMAFQFARLPFMLVTGPLQYVLYPHVAAIREDTAGLRALFLLLTRLLAAGCLPAVALAAAASNSIFHVLLSEKWLQAAPIFALVTPAAAVQPVTAIVGTFLMAVGRTDVQFRLAARYAAVWLVGLALSVWNGIEAVAAAYTVCALGFAAWSLRVSLPLVGCPGRDYARCFMWPAATTAAALLLYRIGRLAEPNGDWANVCLAAGLAAVASGITLAAQRRDLTAASAASS